MSQLSSIVSKDISTCENQQISSSYLVKQAKEIDKIKRHLHILTILDKIFSDMGYQSNRSRKKILKYTNLQNQLETDFSNILEEIASTLIFEGEFETDYLQNGLTKKQLEMIKAWDILESKKRWYQEIEKEEPDMDTKQLEKSKKNIYQSFL